MTTIYNVVGQVVANIVADSPADAETRIDAALRGHGFDTLREGMDAPHKTDGRTFPSEAGSPAETLPAPCLNDRAGWADAVDTLAQWGLKPWEALTLVRLAASAVDTGTLTADTEGFSEPDEVDDIAQRTWKAIAYLGGQP